MQDLILLHGAIGAKDQLRSLAERMKDKYTVHLLNFSGHGGAPFVKEDFSISLFTNEVLNYLRENNIKSIIWATGFDVDYRYIKLPVFDNKGKLKHKDGIPILPGIYFLGYPWLRSRKSPILFGIRDDVEFISKKVYEYAKKFLSLPCDKNL